MAEKNSKHNQNISEDKKIPDVEEIKEVDQDSLDIEDIPEADDALADVTEDEAQGMIQQIQELTAKLEKEKNDYLLLRAEFETYRRRNIKDREELIKNAAEKVLKGLLPIVDDFERGLKATVNVDDATGVREGMTLIYNKLLKYLETNGVKPIESDGKDFDADLHEAIATIPAPSEDMKGKVIDTTTRGYMLNDKVLRHAQVAVGE